MRMKKKDLERYKKMLLKEKEKVLSEIEHIGKDNLNRSQKEASGDISSYTYHMADMATDNYDREFSLNMATNEQKVLFKIEEALQRVKDGTYGICEDCEKPISKKRLDALCYTNLCVNCQEKEESKKGG
ncbi:MAG: TraR/DksA family transcriptional regulator [Candidatus Omnitrophica bacterium]|nr:TraR/DksA family transcriptional regulator [Candidatus Omnitrophota bacterium]